jgi:potassium efflux system protein
VVRNRVRTDRTGRVLISITVPRTFDPGDVRKMLNDAADAHGDVMRQPPPSVQFKKIGTTTMDFDLVCVVADISIVGRVTSDLNFVIHKRLTEMEPEAAGDELTVKGLEGIEQSLDSIAQAVSGEARTGRRKTKARAKAAVRRLPLPDAAPEQAEEAPKPAPEPKTAEDLLKGDNKE